MLLNILQFPSLKFSKNDLFSKKDAAQNWILNQNHFFSKKNIFLKTHNTLREYEGYKFTSLKQTSGAIYIVRDPRNVITSLKNHYKFDNYDDALKFLLDDRKVIGIKNSEKEVDLPHIISSWKNHFNSWKKMEKNYLLIKYENLLSTPEVEFEKITNYIETIFDRKFEKKRVLDAINMNSFDKLKDLEKENGFKEAPKFSGSPISFFNLGKKNNWKNLLNPEIEKKIRIEFNKEMKELNYI